EGRRRQGQQYRVARPQSHRNRRTYPALQRRQGLGRREITPRSLSTIYVNKLVWRLPVPPALTNGFLFLPQKITRLLGASDIGQYRLRNSCANACLLC